MNMVKTSIIEKLKSELKNILVTDTPLNNEKEENNKNSLKVLFAGYNNNNKNELLLIDYNNYEKFRKKSVPNLSTNFKILFNNMNYDILDWNNDIGMAKISKPIKNLYSYNDIFFIENDKMVSNIDNNDFILCYSLYSYGKALNKNIVEQYMRFNIDVFIYEDPHNNKICEYSNKISKIFNRDFKLLDKDKKETKDLIYIINPLSFNVTEYNISNKILRGSMLVKVYKNE